MAWKLEQDILQRLKQRKLKRFWSRTVNVMMCIVVFCTTYALILPAITKETDTFCEMEEHVHTAACYPQVGDLICEFANTEEHVHSEDCVPVTETDPSCGLEEVEPHTHEACALLEEQPLICALEETEGHAHSEVCQPQEQKDLVCTLEEVEGHTHSDACQPQEHKDLICTLEEVEGHSHSDACQPQEHKDLVCTLTEVEGHAHSDACGVEEKKDLICGQEEVASHVHSDACGVQENRDLICGLAEDENHTHGDECYSVTTSYACGLQETEGHSHSDTCFSVSTVYGCGLEEIEGHAHGDACFVVSTVYSCGKEEIEGHIHEDSCFTVSTVYGCGKEEIECHAHGDACFVVSTVYACGLEEVQPHSHTEECYDTLYDCGLTETEGHAHSDSCYITTYGCGLEGIDHIHTEVCYVAESALICTLAESDEHTHSTECYNCPPACGLEEHKHDLECYSDPNADVESSDHWESTLPDLTGVRGADVVAIARSQLGYTESTRNYIVDESDAIKGYTRYGAWYGVPYGDWCGMFASFCLRYAGVNDIPINFGVRPWIEELTALGLYYKTYDVIPTPGCLIFFDWEGDGLSDHVGIVEEVVGTDVIAIEGNSNNRVERNTYSLHDDRIAGYGLLEKSQTEEPEVVVGPNDTDAWAVLIDPSGNIMQVPEAGERAAADVGVSTYNLRRMSAAYQIAPRAGTPLDLTEYINSVTMYDVKGNPIPSGSTVTEGDMIEFRIEYTVAGQKLGVLNGEDLTVNSNTLTYTLPSSLQAVRNDSGQILNSVGQTVGTYTINGDSQPGTITMTFTDDYVEQNANGLQIHGFISFFSTVTEITEGNEEDKDFKFTDNITLGVHIEEKIESVGNLKVKKNKLSVVGEDLVYELIVESTEGTKEPVTITDQMSTGLTFVQGLEVRSGKIGDTANNGTLVTNAQFQPASDNKSFTLTLPAMEPGQAYAVTYKCKADVDLLGADMTVQNTAEVTSKDSQDHDLKDRTTVTHTFDMLDKTGEKNDDGTITWTITINQAKADISGWILDDFMNGNQHFTGTVTIRNSRGGLVAQNVTLPYTFPQGSADTYTVTYTTEYDFDDGSWITNKAVLHDNDTTIEREEGVEIGSPITKSGEAGTLTADNLLPITWTVSIDTSMGAVEGGAVLNDIMSGYGSQDMYMTYEQIMAAYNNINAAISARTGQNLASFTAYEYVAGSQEGSAYSHPNLPQDKVYERFSAQLGSLGIPQDDEPLTFTYVAYGVFPDGEAKNSTFTNRFNIGGKYEVVGTVRYSVGGLYANKAAILYFDPSKDYGDENLWWNGNLGIQMGNGAFDQVEYEKLHDGYLSWIINIYLDLNYSGKEDVVIYEDIPEGLTICDVSYYFSGHVPTRPVRPQFLIPGRSEKVTFTMYPGPEYLKDQEDRQGAFISGITFEVTETGDLKITVPSEVYEALVQYNIAENEKMSEVDWYNPHTYGETFLNIHTRINDDFAWTTEDNDPSTTDVYIHNFENRFDVRSESGKVFAAGSQTQQVKKKETDEKIRKQATVNTANNLIDYSVVLNAYGRDLIPNSDKLHIVDVMTYESTAQNQLRVQLVPDSLRVYEVQMHFDGSYTKLKDITPYYKYDETSVYNSETGVTTWTNTITMDVPDGKALALEYRYLADGITGEGGNVGNTCTITGVGNSGIFDEGDVKLQIRDAIAQADMEGITLCKVDANSDGIYLKNAIFHIYIWNEAENDYIQVHKIVKNGENTEFTDDFITDSNGQIVLSDKTMSSFAYNTAYRMVEVQSPDGYILDGKPFYFQIVNPDEHKTPCLPDNFTGASLTSGDIIYRENTNGATEIQVEKYWQDMSGQSKTVYGDEVSSVTLKLWQKVEGSNEPAVAYGTYEMTPDYRGNWNLTIRYLPKETENDAKYLYYLEEVGITVEREGNDYTLETIENNDGINSGTITLTNKQVAGYILPETGGAGTTLYTMAGLLLMMFSLAYLVYNNVFRRREEA